MHILTVCTYLYTIAAISFIQIKENKIMAKTVKQRGQDRATRLREMQVIRHGHYHHVDDNKVVSQFIRGLNTSRFPNYYVYEGERKKDKKDEKD